ncbi:MAG: response regulator [Candidatus Gracilibacteria bacterium]|jgi:DNA-binding response OmpR family regulator
MNTKKKHIILIVEDEEPLLRALYVLLHGENTIATAGDGQSALEIAQRIKPDIILLDLLLPVMDGFALLKNLKSNSTLKQIPVVILSNLGDEADIGKAKALGAIDYFIKADTDLSVLAKKIKKLI